MAARSKRQASAPKARQLILDHGWGPPRLPSSGYSTSQPSRGNLAFLDEDKRHKMAVFSDVHVKIGLENEHVAWIGKWIKDLKPSFVINDGDFADFPSMCSHEPNDTARGKLKPALKADLDYFTECAWIITDTADLYKARFLFCFFFIRICNSSAACSARV